MGYGRRPGERLKVYTSHPRSPFRHTCDGSPKDDGECFACAVRDCPDHEPLHYHHDGCPCCSLSLSLDLGSPAGEVKERQEK